MKIDRNKVKRSTTEVPPDCKLLIEKLKGCRCSSELVKVLQSIDSWTYGKCELYHWIDVLDIFDSVLQKATEKKGSEWTLACDTSESELKPCVMHVLRFTTLLIEHSFSRHLYNSMEHLTTLLLSSDLNLVLEVLHLLYMFSKRSNFLTRLSEEKREVLLEKLTFLAESWGGKEAGFGLAACCQNLQPSAYPSTAASIHLEFLRAGKENDVTRVGKLSEYVTIIHVEDVNALGSAPSEIMEELIKCHDIPPDKQMLLFTHIRLAYNFPNWKNRVLCVQARLQALSVLVYANAIQDNSHQLLYSGLMEELVDILELDIPELTDIKAAALRTLTSIIHLDRAQNFPNIIDVTGAGSYHGFLPMMVRSCISALTSSPNDGVGSLHYSLPLATALFSFLYHLASYEVGGEALVNCGMLESLLKVVSWNTVEVEHITFVTRAVRVIDLITNMDMQAFQAHNGLSAFISRLEMEVNACRKEQPFEIIPEISAAKLQASGATSSDGVDPSSLSERLDTSNEPSSSTSTPMDTDVTSAASALPNFVGIAAESSSSGSLSASGSASNFTPNGSSCLPQRAALLKSMLNFLKKVIQDPAFSDSIRHIMESSLPNSLKHIISNAEYYGASLFLLASDVVTVYVFQEPSLLSTLQDSGLTDVVQEALLVKEVPATREVISSMPNVFSALCLNSRGLNAFVKCKPFQRLFKVLLSPEYLPAMRRRRTAEPMGDTASNLGNAMDELMRHQPSLRIEATTAIVKLLQDLCSMGQDSRLACCKGQAKPVVSSVNTAQRNGTSEGGSSDEDEDDDEEASTASHTQAAQVASANAREDSNQASSSFITQCLNSADEKTPVPLVDYILNVMKCVDAILSNNSTDDHCREFVNQEGLKPLMEILALPNLPIDFPNSPACQAVSSVCKSILNLAHEGKVLQEGMQHLETILGRLQPLDAAVDDPGSSVLLHELASAPEPSEAVNNPYDAPILHAMTAAHAYVMMFIHVCRTGQSDIRTMSITHWGSELGRRVLKKLSGLYLNLVWESTVLLALCSGEFQPGPNQFGRADLDKLIPGENKNDPEVSVKSAPEIMESDGESSTLPSLSVDGADPMEVDPETSQADNHLVTLVSASTQTTLKQDRTSNATLQNYAKLIKPILSASSRLGRALAELFGLLVKLCVGSPLRQRRNHHNMPVIPGFVSPNSSEVATLIADLLTSGLCWKPKPHSPVPRLTFSICAVGFSAPLLFDEKKFPYHLMLKKFTDSEGLQALFDIFYWAMGADPKTKSSESSQDDRTDLTDHQIEFLDSWLMLLEKFVNPKTVLDSPHALPTQSQTPNQKFWIQFEPNMFLSHVHKLSFEAIMFLWNRKPMKHYGTRAAEAMLAILCHILRHKDLVLPKYTPNVDATGSGSSANQSNVTEINQGQESATAVPNRTEDTEPSSASLSVEAVTLNSNLQVVSESAETTELANASDTSNSNPVVGQSSDTIASRTDPQSASADAAGSASEEQPGPSNDAVQAARSLGVDYEQLQQLSDMGFQFEMCIEALMSTNSLLQATDYLLNNATPNPSSEFRRGNNRTTPSEAGSVLNNFATGSSAMEWDDNDDEQIMRAAIAISLGTGSTEKTMEPLDPQEVDRFSSNVLERCLPLLDQLPESVFRVCELLVAVGQRNGFSWMFRTLVVLVSEILSGVDELTNIAKSKRPSALTELKESPVALKTALRIHLFSLIFEEFKSECSLILEQRSGLDPCIALLTSLQNLLESESSSPEMTPKWVAPLLLMIDLYEKTAIASHRRYVLSYETDHCWKWFDINSGRWCSYSSANNAAIDKAFWSNESSVKILAGRRRYVINFSGMIQLNEETSNRRPITLWLRSIKAEENAQKSSDPQETAVASHAVLRNASSLPVSMDETSPAYGMNEVVDEMESLSSRSPPIPASKDKEPKGKEPSVQTKVVSLKGLNANQIEDIIKASVTFMGIPVESESLHAAMRLCLRLTRDYKVAVIFAHKGGVHMLLKLTQAAGFPGFLPLSNLLIRHVIEDPSCLKYAIEKMIRAKAMSSGASTCKELHYLLRVLAPVACRSPSLFVEVAKNILRVDINCVTRRNDDDMRLIVKPIPCTADNFKTYMGETAQNVIQQLLIALTLMQSSEDDPSSSEHSSANVTNVDAGVKGSIKQTQTNITGDSEEQMELDGKTSKEKEIRSETSDQLKKKPLIPKYAICQLLAESVHSYSYSCKIIAEASFQGGTSPYVPEDCTALAFLLDKMLPVTQTVGEKDCSTIVRDLISAMAGCNHLPDAQAIAISEVKASLARAVNLRESPEKHARIQALAGLICTMIESCPSMPPTHMVSSVKPTQLSMNQVVKLLIRKNLVVDLARIPHHLDLASSQMAATVNAALKPLEMISRIVNQPSIPQLVRPRPKAETHPTHSDSVNNTHTAGTSNSEGTHAQGEEAVEDADNTEHDISGAAESLDPTSESHTHDQEPPEEGDDVPDVLEDIMDQLLDRESETMGTGVDGHSNRMDTEQESNQREHVFQQGEFEDDHDQNETSDSDSDPSDDNEDEGEAGEEDEEDDEDDEEDEDGGSNFDDRDPEMEDIRFLGMDRDDDMLMVQYGGDPENAPVFFSSNTSYNLNMGLFDDPLVTEHPSGLRTMHPLLTPPMSDPPVTGSITTRGHRAGRQRRYQYIQFNPRHPHPPAILQRLLGPSTAQEVIQLTTGQALTQGIRDARLLVMDASADQAIHRNGPAGTVGTGSLANYTALHWWCEEAKALDGESMHDCVVAIKREIVQAVEEDRDNVFKARQDKKQKDSSVLDGLGEPTNINSGLPRPARAVPVDSESSDTDHNRTEEPNTRSFYAEDSAQLNLDSTTEATPIPSAPVSGDQVAGADGECEINLPTGPSTSNEEPHTGAASEQKEEQESLMDTIAPEELEAGQVSVSEPDNGTVHHNLTEDVGEMAQEPPSASGEEAPANLAESESATDPQGRPVETTEPVAGPSGTQSVDDFRGILGDIVIPDGVDPSFLAALPEEIRQEVINEHLRTMRQTTERPQPVAVPDAAAPSLIDVSPEFLAALPPNIQEEVLAQQRMEQQRRVATTSNPNDPVDTEAFFRNLQPSLRQAILADMEESQIAVLPPELAVEAQNLRREWETRNRQILQDHPFIVHSHPTGTTLSSILRNSGVRLNPRFALQTAGQRGHAQWPASWPRITPAVGAHNTLLSGKVKGKQLVDHETLSCLLVLLFVDEPRLNTGRLHRVLRNLCYHASTRQWVIKSLLSVMEKSNDCTTGAQVFTLHEIPDERLPSNSCAKGECAVAVKRVQPQPASWLNITLDAALGCRANVFLIQKSLSSGKKGGSELRSITIHCQAVPSICRHTLDVLSNLAKSFPTQFLPLRGKMASVFLDAVSKPGLVDKEQVSDFKSKTAPATSSKGKVPESPAEFWDLLLKLDSVSSSRKCKSIAKVHSSNSLNQDSVIACVTFEASPFGHLISMLAYPFIRRSCMLTDKLLRLLSLISLGIPDTSGFGRKILLHDVDAAKDSCAQISESHLKLIVDVITSKSCSEEGLEDATSLLLNLSYGPPASRDRILSLLVSGVRELGNVVCGHIAALMNELKQMNKGITSDNREVVDENMSAAGTEADSGDKLFKGTLVNRFTRETVVVTSSSKSKATCELQLPSMAALTSKTSSQAFFLRLLKVIISLRDAIRVAIRNHNQKGSVQSTQNMQYVVDWNTRAPSVQRTEDSVNAEPTNSSSGETNPQGNNAAGSEAAVESMDVDTDNRDGSRVTNQVAASTGATPAGTKPKQDEKPETEPIKPVDESLLLPRLSTLLELNELWDTLSKCLLELGHTPDHHAVLVLQPAVEAFFLVHASSSEREEKKVNVRETREAQLAHLQQELPPVSPVSATDSRSHGDSDMLETQASTLDSMSQAPADVAPDTQKFLNFAETHRTVLNQILRQSTTHLADGPFAVLVDHTRVLDFDVKRRYFRTELERLDEGVRREDLAVHVGRSSVFEDSFRQLQRRSAEEWKNRFYIVFEGEEGQDAGGLLREWYVIISREIFNPMYALFTISPGDRVTYMINPLSHCNSNHLCYFKFVGRVIAKAIYDNKLLECYFTRSFYKHILGKPVKYTDMESEDYSFYQGLVFLMENTVNDLGYDLTFSAEVQEFGVTEDRDLIPNGRNIPVTEENKMEYIRLVCQMKMTGAIRKQLNAFLEGFYDIIPKRLISIFNEQELELLVSGLPNIDIEDLKANTEYHKYQPNSLQIQWFWRALRSFDQADRAKFLQFVTGTSKVPLQGFGALEGMNGVQKFQIHRDDRSTDRLPSAHTCFNQLDLPAYETFDKLRTYLLKAIHECSEGFGFA